MASAHICLVTMVKRGLGASPSPEQRPPRRHLPAPGPRTGTRPSLSAKMKIAPKVPGGVVVCPLLFLLFCPQAQLTEALVEN